MTEHEEREALVMAIMHHPWLADRSGNWPKGYCPTCDKGISAGYNSPAHAEHIADAILAVGYTKPRTITAGAEMIAAERTRQIEVEGYDATADSGQAHALVDAAVCYVHAGFYKAGAVPTSWPWARRFWKPTGDPARNLVKAGALIAAAIDSIAAAATVLHAPVTPSERPNT